MCQQCPFYALPFVEQSSRGASAKFGRGLSEFTNTNFFSQDTNIAWGGWHGWTVLQKGEHKRDIVGTFFDSFSDMMQPVITKNINAQIPH